MIDNWRHSVVKVGLPCFDSWVKLPRLPSHKGTA